MNKIIDNKLITKWNPLVAGTALAIMGLTIMIAKTAFLRLVLYALAIVFALFAAQNLVRWYREKDARRQRTYAYSILINAAIAISFIFMPRLAMSLVPITLALYALLVCFVKGLQLTIISRAPKLTQVVLGVEVAFLFIFGVVTLLTPQMNIDLSLNIVGVYLLLYSVNFFLDFWISSIPSTRKRNIGRHMRVALPSILVMMIPHSVLTRVDRSLNSGELMDITQTLNLTKPESTPNMEVLIHISPSGSGAIGHVDILMDGLVYTYGNYDTASGHFHDSWGDGVMYVASIDGYIDFCTGVGKTLFGFGIQATQNGIDHAQAFIELIKRDAVPWTPDNPECFAAKLNAAVDVRFFKFTRGPFARYFFMGTNCALLTNDILREAGIDLFSLTKIVTPGTYYETLAEAFNREDSPVVSMRVYK